jgi:hypothetical protein
MIGIGFESLIVWLILILLVEVDYVLVIVVVALVVDLLEFLEAFADCDLLLLLLFDTSLLPLFLEILGQHFFQSLTGFTFELVLLLDGVFKRLEIGEMIGESEVLSGRWGTVSADSRCSALMVFLLLDSHMLLALSDSLTMNSKFRKEYLWRWREPSGGTQH